MILDARQIFDDFPLSAAITIVFEAAVAGRF
jgi:hypothetical protein